MAKYKGYTQGRLEHPVLYSAWKNMWQRCTNKNSPAYKNYGGRGIKICLRWVYFQNFVDDMGDPPPGTSLDRINNDKGYNPSNCRWATDTQQARNSRRARVVKIKRKAQCVSEWCEESGISYATFKKRMSTYGWDEQKALTTPARAYKKSARGALHAAFGEHKTLSAWAKDPRCKVSTAGLYNRVARGVPLEEALSTDTFVPQQGRVVRITGI